ncbi:MAG: hypothetical protein LBS16_00245 [Prevotellaceae bacterium]|nr:hypothetical protein [Prevotellaceae bacterium]
MFFHLRHNKEHCRTYKQHRSQQQNCHSPACPFYPNTKERRGKNEHATD